jgi:quercetin dioxygenase-like cupin family protein
LGAEGVYIKEFNVKAGQCITKHVHDFNHYSILLRGSVRVITSPVGNSSEKTTVDVTAPSVLLITKDTMHTVIALTPVTWLCVQSDKE